MCPRFLHQLEVILHVASRWNQYCLATSIFSGTVGLQRASGRGAATSWHDSTSSKHLKHVLVGTSCTFRRARPWNLGLTVVSTCFNTFAALRADRACSTVVVVVEVVVVNNVAPKLLASSWLSDVVPVLLAGLVVDLPFAWFLSRLLRLYIQACSWSQGVQWSLLPTWKHGCLAIWHDGGDREAAEPNQLNLGKLWQGDVFNQRPFVQYHCCLLWYSTYNALSRREKVVSAHSAVPAATGWKTSKIILFLWHQPRLCTKYVDYDTFSCECACCLCTQCPLSIVGNSRKQGGTIGKFPHCYSMLFIQAITKHIGTWISLEKSQSELCWSSMSQYSQCAKRPQIATLWYEDVLII